MDQENFRNIFGIVILPILTVVFFVFGAISEKQPLFVVGFAALCVSLILQFLITRG